jgi:histidyl-tRNA synthetase
LRVLEFVPIAVSSCGMVALEFKLIFSFFIRFEQTVKGRKREHYQWNMDIIGVPNVMGEVELLATIVEFCKLVGLTKDDVCY